MRPCVCVRACVCSVRAYVRVVNVLRSYMCMPCVGRGWGGGVIWIVGGMIPPFCPQVMYCVDLLSSVPGCLSIIIGRVVVSLVRT